MRKCRAQDYLLFLDGIAAGVIETKREARRSPESKFSRSSTAKACTMEVPVSGEPTFDAAEDMYAARRLHPQSQRQTRQSITRTLDDPAQLRSTARKRRADRGSLKKTAE